MMRRLDLRDEARTLKPAKKERRDDRCTIRKSCSKECNYEESVEVPGATTRRTIIRFD
jgi:hypothetical protein